MVSKKNVMEEMDFLSDRISSQVRTIALGLLAITWGLLIGQSVVAAEISRDTKGGFLVIGTIAILSMFLDFLQYFFGYWNNRKLLNKMEEENKQEGEYNYLACSYRLRDAFFWIKQVSLMAGVLGFLFLVLKYLV